MDLNFRYNVCHRFLDEISDHASLSRGIMFTDESMLYLNANIATPHNYYWCTERTGVPVLIHGQYNPRFMVWCGVHDGRVIGLYVFDRNVNGVFIIQ